MMSESTFTFRVDETLKTEFSTAAKASDRSGAQLLREFMRAYVQRQQETFEHDTWFRAKVREAQADTQQGVPHQQVMDEAQALIDRKRRARA